MRGWLIALTLFVSLASEAFAGGIHARIEGPAHDGITYTARAYECDESVTLEPWAYAEGLVDGKRRSVLLRLTPASERGVYRFARTWPEEGRWLIRFSLGHPPAPATVAILRADGAVQSNKLYFKSDGSEQCRKALRSKSDDDGC